MTKRSMTWNLIQNLLICLLALVVMEVFACLIWGNENQLFNAFSNISDRSLEHSTILYETPDAIPLYKVKWNLLDRNYISVLSDKSIDLIDLRMPSTPCLRLLSSSSEVQFEDISFAPHSSSHISVASTLIHCIHLFTYLFSTKTQMESFLCMIYPGVIHLFWNVEIYQI